MPWWLPDPLWPWLLITGLAVLIPAFIYGDRRATWVALWCTVGIAAMQLPFPEPIRWIWAATLYAYLALLVGVRRGCLIPAIFLWSVWIGYVGLAFIDSRLVPMEGRNIAFAITEIGWLLALLAGARGLPSVIGDDRGADPERGGMAGNRLFSVAPAQDRKEG